MNILYLTISDLSDLNKRGIYTDLIGEFVKQGHHVSIVTPTEKRKQESTRLVFDFIFYASPPITFAKVVEFIKKQDGGCELSDVERYFPAECSGYRIAEVSWS